MSVFFEGQMDFIRFFYGLALIMLCIACLVLERQKIKGLPWRWIGVFGLLHGLQEWTAVFFSGFFIYTVHGLFDLTMSVGSFLCLIEFGLRTAPRYAAKLGRLAYPAPLVLTAIGGLAGMSGIDAVSRYSMALPGGLLSSASLFVASLQKDLKSRGWLASAGIALGIYSLLLGLVPNYASFLPASLINKTSFFEILGVPVQLLKGGLAGIIAISIWAYAQSLISTDQVIAEDGMKWRTVTIPAVVFISIIAAGWVMTETAGRHARSMELRDSNIQVSTIANHFTDETAEADRAAMDLAESDLIREALTSQNVINIKKAESAMGLCNYSAGSESFRIFLLDRAGRTLSVFPAGGRFRFDPASSRISETSFSEALKGGFRSYYGSGPWADERSYYVYHPVKDRFESVLGVVVIVKGLDEIEMSFKKHQYCFLIDPHGAVFLSSRADLHNRGLWPLSAARQRYLAESGQFGPGPFPAMLHGEASDGDTVEFEGHKLLSVRRSLGSDGWSLVLLTSTSHIRAYRMFSILTTFVLFGLTAAFFIVIYLRRQSMAKIAASERLYRGLVESSPNCVALFDSSGRCLAVNRAGILLTGLSEEEIIGRRIDEVWHGSGPYTFDEILKSVSEGGRFSYEVRGTRPDGSHVIWSVHLGPLNDAEGGLSQVVGIFIDITDRHAAEEDLRRHKENLEDLVLDRTRELSETNELLKIEMTERIKAEEELQRYSGRLQQLVDERTLELRTAVSLLTNEINFRKGAENTLKESESKFRSLSQEFHALLDAMTDELLLVSRDLRILWANKAFAESAKVEASALKGQPCHEIWCRSGQTCECCCALDCFRTGVPQNVQIRSSAGRFHDIASYPISDENGEVKSVIIAARDVTEKLSLQAEAMRAAHLASLGELSAGVAHEINNPITGIINYAQILANRTAAGSKDNDIAHRIIREGERIAVIVKSLLSFAREKKGDRTSVSFRDILMDSLMLTETQIRKDSIDLKLDIPEDLPCVHANSQQIVQVVLNIISNARYALNMKFQGARRGKVLDISCNEFIQDDIRNVRMVFRDNGIGMPGEILQKVVTPFFTTKPVGLGTGLGLSISHGIIADHGGRLKIESVEGSYTSVSIELPVKERYEQQQS